MSSENQNPYLEIIKDAEASNRGVMRERPGSRCFRDCFESSLFSRKLPEETRDRRA